MPRSIKIKAINFDLDGVIRHFDPRIVAIIEHTKPDTRVYSHVLKALGLKGSEVFFTHDRAANVAAAAPLSIVGHHCPSVELLAHALAANGVDVS